MEAYDGCIPLTVYMVQKYVGVYLRQIGKHQRVFRQEKGSGTNVAVV